MTAVNARRLAEEIQLNRPFQLPELEAFLNLVRTADQLSWQIGDVFKRRGVTMQQYNVLRILRGAGKDGLTCSQIGERMLSRDPDITRLLDRLERYPRIYYAQSVGWDLTVPPSVPILCVSRFLMAHWQLHAPRAMQR